MFAKKVFWVFAKKNVQVFEKNNFQVLAQKLTIFIDMYLYNIFMGTFDILHLFVLVIGLPIMMYHVCLRLSFPS